MTKVCPNCGFSNDDNATVCLKCGYPLSEIVLAELPIVISSDGSAAYTAQITGKSLVLFRNDSLNVGPAPKRDKLNVLLALSLAEFTGLSIFSLISNAPLGIVIALLVADLLLLLPIQGANAKHWSDLVRRLQLEGQRLFIMKYEVLGNCNNCEVLKKEDIKEFKIIKDGNSCIISLKDVNGRERKFYIPNLNAASVYNFLVRTSWKEKLSAKV